jgi:hypothetical protein
MKVVAFIFLLFCSYLLAAQNVGIGTTDPKRRLHVAGTALITDSLVIGSPNSRPTGFLDLPAELALRKLVLYSNTVTGHSFDGFGTDGDALRYQTTPGIDHVFYSALSGGAASKELLRIEGHSGYVGLGVSEPNAPLHFQNVPANRKIVLYESFNNDHQFYGFGAINSTLRYQVSDVQKDHVFYAASSATNSNELFRIKGYGQIGVGVADPLSHLSNTNVNITGPMVGMNTGSLSWAMNEQGYTQGLYNGSSVVGANGLLVKIAGTTGVHNILTLATGATANGPSVAVMVVQGDGNVGMGNNLNVTGSISKGGGSFKIDHPLDPANKFLYHSFVESPDMMNIYNGNTVTGNDGLSEITLPDYFEALNKDFRYQLTVIGDFAQAIIAKKVAGNKFVIKTDKPHIEVSWQITGIRHDPYAEKNRIPNSVDKAPNEKGHYLHPEARTNRTNSGTDEQLNN